MCGWCWWPSSKTKQNKNLPLKIFFEKKKIILDPLQNLKYLFCLYFINILIDTRFICLVLT